MGLILIMHSIYTIIFKFSRIRLGLGLGFFADVHYMIYCYYYTVQLYWNGLVP